MYNHTIPLYKVLPIKVQKIAPRGLSERMAAFEDSYFTKSYCGHLLRGRKPLHYRRWLRDIRKVRRTGTLLDIGCGKGFFMEVASRHFANLVGVDVSEYALKFCKKAFPATSLCRADATQLPFRKDSFDVITCFDVLEHLRDPQTAVSDLGRVLRENGTLAVMTPNPDSLGRTIKGVRWFGFRDETHIALKNRHQWVSILTGAGLAVTKAFHTGLWDSPYLPHIPRLLQDMVFKIGFTFLFWSGIRIPEKLGEDLCLIANKTPPHSTR